MNSRVNTKVAFDSVTGILFTLGTAGLGFGVYQKELVPGLFGIASILLGLFISYKRNTWNEGEKIKMQDNLQKAVEENIVKAVPVLVRKVKPIVKPIIEDVKKDIKEEIKEKTEKIGDKVEEKIEKEIKEAIVDEVIRPLFDTKKV